MLIERYCAYCINRRSNDISSTRLPCTSSRRCCWQREMRCLAVPFSLENGKLDVDAISSDEKLLQEMWRAYFKAICIRERLNPRKQLTDMPRRYWRYMTEKQ